MKIGRNDPCHCGSGQKYKKSCVTKDEAAQAAERGALAAAQAIGKVTVDMGGTACKVPLATESIQKVIGLGRQGKKRKTAMC